ELLRVTPVRADVVIPKHDRTRGARRDLADNFVDRPVADGPRTIQERNRAIVAAVGTTSRRDRDRLAVAASLDKVPARSRHAGEGRLSRRDINGLELSATCVFEDPGPGILSLAHNDCVGVARGLLGERGRVWSADHNGHGAATEFPGETVSVKCGR